MNEATVEHAALDWFEAVGFDVATGGDISQDGRRQARDSYSEVVLLPRLEATLRRINPQLSEDAIHAAVRVVARPTEPTLAQNNRWFHALLTDGIDVENRLPDGEIRGGKAWLVDWNHVRTNDFLVVSQLIVKEGNHHRKPDLVVFLNGLPVAVIELKDIADEQADVWKAFQQLQEYKRTIPTLFHYNEVLAVSDGDSTRVGSLTAGADRFAPWRGIDDARAPGEPTLKALIKGLFTPAQLLDYLRHAISFEEDPRSGEIIKRIAGYHQFRAVRKARESVKQALKSPHASPLPTGEGTRDGRGGVIWHTQGSGKSLTMLMLAGALIADESLANPTIVIVTDRNDLDNQLFDTFANGRALLRQPPEQAESRDDLAAKLDRASGGVVFTTLQKFEQRADSISERANIVVLADEAHRSQYGFVDGGARWMREALPNATFVGFTGTPIEHGDKNTQAVFGDYTDVYDIRQAIDDNATVPIYYEMRLVKLLVDQEEAAVAEEHIAALAAADREGQEVPHDVEVASEQVIGSPDRVAKVAREIVDHFEKRREAIEGKAMAVCMSREICMDLYDAIRALRPDWHADDDNAGFMKVVMDANVPRQRDKESDADYERRVERVKYHGRTKGRRESLAKRFKGVEDDLRLVIVCDMWLTGFDCPPMHTMYLDKPLAGHNLMQAIARVNRVFGDKPGGVVVDFLGIAEQLRDAVQTYTQAGGVGSPVADIQKEAIPLMQRHFEELTSYFHGLDTTNYFDGDPADRIRAVTQGVDFVVENDDKKRRFLDMVAKLSKTFALSVPLSETEPIRDPLAFFQAVRAAIRKRLSSDGTPPTSDMRGAVRQVIAGTVFSDGVIDLYQAAGLPEQNVGILSDEFLDRLASLPEKNLALETLRKLLNDQVRSRERVNIVQSRKFREALEQALVRYNNRAITTAQVIEEMIHLAREFQATIRRGEATGLTEDEIAFYDALANNESAKQAMQDDSLRFIARELANKIRDKTTLDWTQREAVRADMRRSVKRLLNKYGYPPDLQKAATELVIQQAELMAENMLLA
jgi:type I restriction enzyme R subunit